MNPSPQPAWRSTLRTSFRRQSLTHRLIFEDDQPVTNQRSAAALDDRAVCASRRRLACGEASRRADPTKRLPPARGAVQLATLAALRAGRNRSDDSRNSEREPNA